MMMMMMMSEPKGRTAEWAYHNVEYDAETPDVVGGALVGYSLKYLRSSVGGAATVRPAQLIRTLDSGKAEVR